MRPHCAARFDATFTPNTKILEKRSEVLHASLHLVEREENNKGLDRNKTNRKVQENTYEWYE